MNFCQCGCGKELGWGRMYASRTCANRTIKSRIIKPPVPKKKPKEKEMETREFCRLVREFHNVHVGESKMAIMTRQQRDKRLAMS